MKNLCCFFLVLIISAGCISKLSAQNYRDKRVHKNTIYLEAQGDIALNFFAKYERTIFVHHLNPNWYGKLFPVAGIGYAYNGGLDVVRRHYYGFLGGGYALGWRQHQLELDLGLLIENEKNGYLTLDGGEQETEYHPKIIIAYRYESRRMLFRFSINPEYDPNTPLGANFWPGLGIGFRF